MIRRFRLFIDSSVLIAAAISAKGFARDLLVLGLRGECTLLVSGLVLDETERNLRRKVPAAIPAFQTFRAVFADETVEPGESQIAEAARVVDPKDAPILAAALHARADYLVTYDRRHLLSHASAISAQFGITVATPDGVLSLLRDE